MNQNVNENGVNISAIDRLGFTLTLGAEAYRLTFEAFPWFKYCTVPELLDVRADCWGVYWDSAGVELERETLAAPEAFPLADSVDKWLEARRRKVAAVLGRSVSARKAAASRANGARGGRPRKKSLVTA